MHCKQNDRKNNAFSTGKLININYAHYYCKLIIIFQYLCELSLLEAEPCLETLPSVMACSGIALARFTLDIDVWTTDLSSYTGYELKNLKKTIEFLYDMFVKAPLLPQQAIQEKYKSGKYLHVSSIKPKDISTIIN